MIFFFTVRNHSGGARDPAFPPERRDMNRLTVAEAQKLASPAPFALLSVKREDGKTNLMALSWWSFLSNHPPMLGVCLSKKGLSGSLIEKNGEFALSLVGPALKDSAFRCGCCSGRVVDKAEDFGIPLEDAQAIGAQVVSGSRAVFECRLLSTAAAGDHVFYIAEIVAAQGDGGVDQLFAFDGYKRLDTLGR